VHDPGVSENGTGVALNEAAIALFRYFYFRYFYDKALPVVARVGSTDPVETDGGGGADAQTAAAKHPDPPAIPDYECVRRIPERQNPMGQVHGERIRNKRKFQSVIYFHCGGWTCTLQPLNSRKSKLLRMQLDGLISATNAPVLVPHPDLSTSTGSLSTLPKPELLTLPRQRPSALCDYRKFGILSR
jgi:hypothetical protein